MSVVFSVDGKEILTCPRYATDHMFLAMSVLRLFISALMIASKVICDDTYSNNSWGIVGQGMFQLQEANQMEREMCQYLDWRLSTQRRAPDEGHL